MPFYPPTTSYTDHELRRIVKDATRKAFEQVAKMADEEGRGYRDADQRLVFEVFAEKIRALAKAEEQADG